MWRSGRQFYSLPREQNILATPVDVWKHFSLLHFSNDYSSAPGQYTGFLLCYFCKNALKNNRAINGTTHLRDYMTHCLENPSSQHSRQTTSKPITAYFKTPQQLSQSDQKKLVDASIEYIARDIRPFKAVEDPGLLCCCR